MATHWSWTLSEVLDQLTSTRKWSGSTISYAFAATADGMTGTAGEKAGFHAVHDFQQPTLELALKTWDDLIPQSLVKTTGRSDIEFALSTGIDQAHATASSQGSVWLPVTTGILQASPGSYEFSTLLREAGQALGLNAMGTNRDPGGMPLPSSYQDSRALSVMSDFGAPDGISMAGVMPLDWISYEQGRQVISPQTPMLNDVAAIQKMYGVSQDTRLGDTVYGFSSTLTGPDAALYDFTINRNPALTIFDSGGVDTLNLNAGVNNSGWANGAVVYLYDGMYSSLNGMTDNLAIARGCVIENVIGGAGNDTLTGNSVANRIEGGVGDDNLYGENGDDVLIGGSGRNLIYGGKGTDTAVFDMPFSSASIEYFGREGAFKVGDSSTGVDWVHDVEWFQFTDVLKSREQLLSSDHQSPGMPAMRLVPANNQNGLLGPVSLVLNFGEAVRAGSGNIVIHTRDGAVAQTISITDDSRVSFDSIYLGYPSVMIDLSKGLASGNYYYATLAPGVIKDLAGNDFDGIESFDSFTFLLPKTDPDHAAPTLEKIGPGASSPVVQLLNPRLTLEFNEPVVMGHGNLTIWREDGTLMRSFAADSGNVSISGNWAEVRLAEYHPSLLAGINYYLTIDDGAFKDMSGNGFAGLSIDKAFKFSPDGFKQTADDFGWAASTAGVVVVDGNPAEGRIESTGDRDLFKVELVAGTHYVFNLRHGQGNNLGDSYLQVFDSGLERLAFDASHGGAWEPRIEPRIEFTASSSGLYYLGAQANTAFGDTGAYSVSARVNTDDYSDNRITEGRLLIGEQVAGRLELQGDHDWFKVDLRAHTSYSFELLAGVEGNTLANGGNSPAIALMDGQGHSVRWSSGTSGNNPTAVFEPSADGSYYVSVSDLRELGTGTYELRTRLFSESRPAHADFDGDGRSDILWRNESTGAVDLWQAGSFIARNQLAIISDLKWHIVATDDFNGDGKSDIFWRHSATGENYLWDGGEFAARQALTTVSDLAWKVAGTGDFDGDGKSDILWRNSSTGENYLWNHGDFAARQALTTVSDLAWKIAGTGDFDGDGKSDILWRNSSTGENYLWNHGDFPARQALTTVSDLAWKIAGTGDFDGDGKSDILWRNSATGEVDLWRHGDFAARQGLTTVADLAWKIAGTGDYDGDGKDDVVWRNSSTGEDVLWKGAVFANRISLTTVDDQAWTPMPGGSAATGGAQALHESLDDAQFDFGLLAQATRPTSSPGGQHSANLDSDALVFDFSALSNAPAPTAFGLAIEPEADHHAQEAWPEPADQHPVLTADLLHTWHAPAGDYFQ